MATDQRRNPDWLAEMPQRLWTHLEPVRRGVRARLEVDTRALAAMRIALGTIILADLLHRAGSLETYYTDAGAYPLAAYEATYSRFTGLSIHAWSGELWFQQLLFVVAGAFAVALILGYRTRIVGAISFVLLFSLHARNPAMLNGADRLLRVVLFVALLTPLGERWSVDALRRGTARTTVVGTVTAAVLLQPVVVFTQNAVLKHQGETWYSGEALGIALTDDEMTILLGNHLAEYPMLLEALTWGWVILLSGSVVFLLGTRGWLRALAVGAYLGAFAGMALSMSVGLFPFVLAASLLPFIQRPFWDALERVAPNRLTQWRPKRSWLGPLERPPLEHRVLASLRERGYESLASFVPTYGRSLLTVAGVLVVAWMLLFGAAHASEYDVPDAMDSPHLDEQRWGLYAPDPSDSYGWFVFEAELTNGASVDAFDGGELTFDRPPDAAQEYESFRERKFLESVRDSGTGDETGIIARSYGEWACEQAAETHDAAVEEITVHRFVQQQPIDGESEAEPNSYVPLEWSC